jgi:hypothetical protein
MHVSWRVLETNTAVRALSLLTNVFAFGVLLPDHFVAFADLGPIGVAAPEGEILLFAS